MFNIKATLFPVIFTLVMTGGLRSEDEGILARYRFLEGDVLIFKQTETSDVEMMGMKNSQKFIQHVEWHVKEVEEEVATIVITIKRVKANIENPISGKAEYDSGKSGEAPTDLILRGIASMVGKPITAKMNSAGKILEVDGCAKIGEEFLKKLNKEEVSPPMREMIKRGFFEKAFSDDEMKKKIACLYLTFPVGKLNVGTEWENGLESTFPLLGELTLTQKCKIESVEQGVVKTGISGMLEKSVKEESGEKSAAEDPMFELLKEMKISACKIKGSNEFDFAKGLMKSQETEMVLTVDLMGMKIPMNMNYLVELKKVVREGKEIDRSRK